jgi:hypothetical protein
MNQKEFISYLDSFFKEALSLVERKNHDYASKENPFKNFNFANLVGVSPERAILIRVADKMARISNLLDKDRLVADESIRDSLIDSANYLAILSAMLESKKDARKNK